MTTQAYQGYQGKCGIDVVSVPTFRIDFKNESLTLREAIIDFNGLRGTRAHSVERTRPGEQVVSGQLTFEPTTAELAQLLPWILNAATVTGTGSAVVAPAAPSATIASGGTLIASTTYYYKISSINAFGESLPGTEVSAAASGGNLKVNLAWTAATGATGYKIYRGTAAGAENVLVALVMGQSTAAYTDLGALIATPVLGTPTAVAGGSLSSGTPYYYVMSATNANGETVQSAEVTITPSGGNLSVGLTWAQIAGATGYRLYRSTTTATYGATSLLAVVTGGSSVSYTDTGTADVAGQPLAAGTAFTALAAAPLAVTTAASGTVTYALGEAAVTRFVMIDRVGQVFTYSSVAVDKATFRSSRGAALTLTLDLVGVLEQTGSAGSFPSLNLDVSTKPLLFFDCVLTVAGTVYFCDSFTLMIENFIDKNRFFNSKTLTAVIATDRKISFQTKLPYGDAVALYGAGVNGVAMSSVFTYGNEVLSFTAGTVVFPHESPMIQGRSEILFPLNGTLYKSGSTLELSTALTIGP